jgi:hypothetical protein
MGLAEDDITLDATALADLVRQRQVSPAERFCRNNLFQSFS